MIKSEVVKMYRNAIHQSWQEEAIENAEYIAYFLRIEDSEFGMKGKPARTKVLYFKLGEWWELFNSKEHPFVKEVVQGDDNEYN